MKKLSITCFFISAFFIQSKAQGLDGLIKQIEAATDDTAIIAPTKTPANTPANKSTNTTPITSSNTNTIFTNNKGLGKKLSKGDITSGLKEALKVAAANTSKQLSLTDGFFGNAAIKILMPDEAKQVEATLRDYGMGKIVDKAVLSMNRAAEDASAGIGNIFFDAITKMTLADGLKILQGNNTAATDYLKQTTTSILTEKFRPIITASLTKVNAANYWKSVFKNYNRLAIKKVNPDLVAYVTDRALVGLFYNIGLEEQKIRKDPAAQVTGILQKVFGGK